MSEDAEAPGKKRVFTAVPRNELSFEKQNDGLRGREPSRHVAVLPVCSQCRILQLANERQQIQRKYKPLRQRGSVLASYTAHHRLPLDYLTVQTAGCLPQVIVRCV